MRCSKASLQADRQQAGDLCVVADLRHRGCATAGGLFRERAGRRAAGGQAPRSCGSAQGRGQEPAGNGQAFFSQWRVCVAWCWVGRRGGGPRGADRPLNYRTSALHTEAVAGDVANSKPAGKQSRPGSESGTALTPASRSESTWCCSSVSLALCSTRRAGVAGAAASAASPAAQGRWSAYVRGAPAGGGQAARGMLDPSQRGSDRLSPL